MPAKTTSLAEPPSTPATLTELKLTYTPPTVRKLTFIADLTQGKPGSANAEIGPFQAPS
jgi:hypothetical protein